MSNNQVCDGIPDCTLYQEDETALQCPDRFRCAASGGRISVTPSEVCDGTTIDCDDGLDESIETCSTSRFYCSQGGGKVLLLYSVTAH